MAATLWEVEWQGFQLLLALFHAVFPAYCEKLYIGPFWLSRPVL